MLRFQEALGRQFEDPASDSSWSEREIKDLDSNQGSHIRPGKLKSAVLAGKLKDLDNYFQLGTLAKEPDVLKYDISVLLGRVQGINNQMVLYAQQIEKGVDKRTQADINIKITDLRKQRDLMGHQIAEKQAKLDELAKNPPISYPLPPTLEEVLKAGYAPEAAAGIMATEAAKAAAGIKPYGPNEPSPVANPFEAIPPAPAPEAPVIPPVAPEPAPAPEPALAPVVAPEPAPSQIGVPFGGIPEPAPAPAAVPAPAPEPAPAPAPAAEPAPAPVAPPAES